MRCGRRRTLAVYELVLRWSREKAAQTSCISSLPVEPRRRRDTRPPERRLLPCPPPQGLRASWAARSSRTPTATTRRTTSSRRRRPVRPFATLSRPSEGSDTKAATPNRARPAATPKAATPARSTIDDDEDDGYDDDFNESPQKPKKTADRPLKIGSLVLSSWEQAKLMRVADEDELMARADKTLKKGRKAPVKKHTMDILSEPNPAKFSKTRTRPRRC